MGCNISRVSWQWEGESLCESGVTLPFSRAIDIWIEPPQIFSIVHTPIMCWGITVRQLPLSHNESLISLLSSRHLDIKKHTRETSVWPFEGKTRAKHWPLISVSVQHMNNWSTSVVFLCFENIEIFHEDWFILNKTCPWQAYMIYWLRGCVYCLKGFLVLTIHHFFSIWQWSQV